MMAMSGCLSIALLPPALQVVWKVLTFTYRVVARRVWKGEPCRHMADVRRWR